MGTRTSTKTEKLWGSAGWWVVVVMSIPFSLYAYQFLAGDFEVYRKMNVAWASGNFAVAGHNIRDHLRAWQIHSLAAEVFLLTGPFQFSPSFRGKFPTVHRQMGYAFLTAGAVLGLGGITVMVRNSDFPTIGRTVFFTQGLYFLACLMVAVQAARRRNFRVHQKFIIRAAAVGYSVMFVRVLLSIVKSTFGISWLQAADLSAFLAPIIFGVAAEIYIRTALNSPGKPTTKRPTAAAVLEKGRTEKAQ